MISSLYMPVLITFPLLIGIFLLSPLFSNHIIIRRIGVISSIIEIFIALFGYFIYLPSVESCNSNLLWSIPILNNNFLENLGINIKFGVDRLSIIMILLTTIIFYLSITYSKLLISHHHKLFYSLVLILEAVIIGIFSATDMFLFFMLWELELIPMYLLISIWGNKKSKQSALKFILYTLSGSMFLLIGFLFIYYTSFANSGILTADINSLNMNHATPILQIFITIALLLGFGVKIPIVPLHRWLADTHTNAITPVSIILAGILLKLGVYGIIRFNINILPLGFAILTPILGFLAIINIVLGATLAYYQNNIKRIVAYSSISQMGIILLGLTSLTVSGYAGAVYHSFSHGIIAAGMFTIAGIIKQKFGTGNLNKLSGIATVAPKLYGFALIIFLACAGIPLLSGFIGEFLSIYGAITSSVVLIKLYGVIAICILLLSALYILKIINKAFMGTIPIKFSNVQDIATHEFIILGVVSFITILLGCLPFIILNFIIQ